MHGRMRPLAVARRTSEAEVDRARVAADGAVVNPIAAEIEAREAELGRKLIEQGMQVVVALRPADGPERWVEAEVLHAADRMYVEGRAWDDAAAPVSFSGFLPFGAVRGIRDIPILIDWSRRLFANNPEAFL